LQAARGASKMLARKRNAILVVGNLFSAIYISQKAVSRFKVVFQKVKKG
jgi:hypothetical protein